MNDVKCKLAAAACAAIILGLAAPAWACGGMFCNAQTTAPAPVDQTAERIVFEVNEDDIAAHIQIQYTGSADDFAWVVPVPDVPEVEESTSTFIQQVETATQMRVQLPTPPTCPGASQPTGGFDEGGGGGCIGCGASAPSSAEGTADRRGTDGVANAEEPVTVHEIGQTANYEFATISAENADDLVAWLNDNGYNVSENMEPVMQPYADQDMTFAGFKLRDGKEVSDIQPVKITYAGQEPMIPIQLTAVAAQPSMGILVFILSNSGSYGPKNYDVIEPVADEILHDDLGNTNYFEWAARRADEREGDLWILEYSGATPGQIQDVSHTRLSRYYTRMSPQHMTTDPVFHRRSVMDRPATLNLSNNPAVQCNDFQGPLVTVDERMPAQCAFNYCGSGATCVVKDGLPHCICAAGDVAQRITGPDGSPSVICQPSDNPFGITPEAGGAGTQFDPCNDYDCGEGSCVLKNGFPTCECSEDAAACVNPSGPGLICSTVPGDLTTYGPGAGPESQGSDAPLEDLIGEDPETAGGGLLFLLLLLAGARLRLNYRK